MKTKTAIGIVALIIAGLLLSMKPMSKLLPLPPRKDKSERSSITTRAR